MSIFSKIANAIFGPPEQRAEQAYNMGMKELEKGREFYAEYHLKTSVKLAPSSCKYLLAYGNILLMKGKLHEAIAQYENAASSEEAPAILFSNWGVALRLIGQLEESLKRHEEALALAPGDPETLMNASVTLLSLEQNERASSLLKKVIEIDPNNADAHFNLVNIEGSEAGEDVFLQRLDIASLKEELKADVFLIKSEYLLSTGKEEKAVDLLSQALDLNPELCEQIELNQKYSPLKELAFYQNFLSQKPKSMFSCLTEAECTNAMPNIEQGERKSLVILAFAKHGGEAKELAQAALNEAGWGSTELGAMMPAQKEGLSGHGTAAKQGWELAEQNGAHIFVF